MVESVVVKSVVDVVSAVQETQQSDVAGFASEFYSGSNWIKQAFESCKRKIIESNGMEDECNKKRKALAAEETASNRGHIEVDKENSHPNITITESISKQATGKKQVAFSIPVDREAKRPSINIMSLKVAELRMHLRERGLDTTGLKKVLQQRLENALNGEGNNEENSVISSGEKKSEEEVKLEANEGDITSNEKKVQVSDGTNVEPIQPNEEAAPMQSTLDTEMEDCTDEKKEEHKRTEIDQNNEKPTQDEDVEMADSEQAEDEEGDDACDASIACEMDNKQSQKKTFGQKLLKATRKVFSPNKNKNSPVKSKKLQSPGGAFTTNKEGSCVNPISVQEQTGVTHEEPHQPLSNSESLSAEKEDPKSKHSKRASMICNMTVEEIKNAEVKSTNKESSSSSSSSTQKDKVNETVQSTPALSKTNYSSASSQKLRSMKEARKARLDEIRNKVHTNSKTLSQLTSGKATASSTASSQKIVGKDAADRKRAIALQMRQKAAAAATRQYANSTVKSEIAAQPPQTIQSPEKLKPQQEPKMQPVQHQAKTVRSPMETYEMSDRGESDSDDSDYSDREPKKKIPKWAQRDNLRAALEKQFLDGPGKIDPDNIFPEVSTCDLEAIFDQRKKRYLKRTSSGNWTKDKVTITEKLVYKRNMGFKK